MGIIILHQDGFSSSLFTLGIILMMGHGLALSFMKGEDDGPGKKSKTPNKPVKSPKLVPG